ncbi:PREDICTED: apoptosis facilitator Bcl-2-like protein 14 [Chrysochloris asiatica]|uniref:Apoptosis facilitator Bcl-2-like protein 14 n=1 Tax=Chrysochloris asiatica TaxID=185453 RepID=A0A9B0TT04_CHRAS|nr:PREDICTED: apoptosis facilitator Bcl-2-like protein 14 [Chrysochloris asiatica]
MCTTRDYDLEEIPLDDDDSNTIEFRILAFYAKHHVFKSTPDVFSPKLPITRSLSYMFAPLGQRTQTPKPSRSSQPSDKRFAKKTSFGIPYFRGGGVKDVESAESYLQGNQRPIENQGGFNSLQWSQSSSNVEPHKEQEAVNPKVVSIANRVAEIVHSWPPPEESHTQGGSSRFKENFVPQGSIIQLQGSQSGGTSAKKDGEQQIIAKIVELLKCSGDQLDRELRKDKALMSAFQKELTYYIFRTIIDRFLWTVDTRGESEVKAQGFKAALVIDAAAKLTAIDNHPMNRVLGFGTKYLKENFSPWIQQHGGWEKVLGVSSHEEID